MTPEIDEVIDNDSIILDAEETITSFGAQSSIDEELALARSSPFFIIIIIIFFNFQI